MDGDGPAPGEIIGRYRVTEKIGEGAFGTVYRGEDVRLRRTVALKVPHRREGANGDDWGRLLAEARSASALNHPNICNILDVGEDRGWNFIAMEYVAGKTLEALENESRLAPNVALDYAIQMAGALAHAHRHGVVHRDLKASNVIVSPDGQAKLLDFGLAIELGSAALESMSTSHKSLAEIGGAAGTLCTMAPELLRGHSARAESDLWSFGVVLYQMLSGKLPFKGATAFEMSMAIMVAAPEPLGREVPAELCAIVAKCLEKDLKSRYASAEDLLRDLESERARLVRSAKRPPVRRLPVALAAAAALLAVTGALAWRGHMVHPQPPAAPAVQVIRAPVVPAKPAVSSSAPPATSPSPTPPRVALRQPGAAVKSSFPGTPAFKVWANTKTLVYHCSEPPSAQTGKNWKSMTQIEAEKTGFRASRNNPCS